MIAAATPSANIQTCCYPVSAKATDGNIAGFFSLTIRVILQKFNNQSVCLEKRREIVPVVYDT